MAFHHSPQIVTRGLLLALDVVNTKSYSSGNTWHDLSGNNYDFDRTGHMPLTAVADGIKYFNFTETPDTYLTESTLSNYNFGSTISVDIWVKNTGGDYRSVIGNGYSTGRGFDMRFSRSDYYGGADNGTRLSLGLTTTGLVNGGVGVYADLDNWGNYVGTYDGTTTIIYKNGVFWDSNTTISGNLQQTVQDVYIGRLADGTTGEDLVNPLSIVKVHNVVLTPAEILQNYNALKGRFGK